LEGISEEKVEATLGTKTDTNSRAIHGAKPGANSSAIPGTNPGDIPDVIFLALNMALISTLNLAQL